MTRYDPSTVIPIFIVIIVIAGVVYANTSRQKFLNQTIAESIVHDDNSPSPTPTSTPAQSATPSPSASNSPIPTSQTKATPKPTIMAQTNTNNSTNNNDLNQFRYPNGKIISSGNTQITIESTDTPNQITDWYKQKIQGLGMNTQSFVSTNTNNNVLNSLAAAGNGINIKIEIRKDAGDSVTTIKISQ